jgi:hypothetical protein
LIEEEKAVATVEKYIRDINVFADWLGNKAFDNDGTLNCVLGTEGHIAVLDAVHSDGIGGHCRNKTIPNKALPYSGLILISIIYLL